MAENNTQVTTDNTKDIRLQGIGTDLDLIASSLPEGITSNSKVTGLVSIYYPQKDTISLAQSPRKTSVPNTLGKPLHAGKTIEPDNFIFSRENNI